MADPWAGSVRGPKSECHDHKHAGEALPFNACVESGRGAGHPGLVCVIDTS